MPYAIDFHTHSACSADGTIPPADLVASAVQNNPALTHMALSDHNTYAGCRAFLDACRPHGIEGYISAEISGTHPDLPDTEFHFLTCFGTQWTDAVADRTRLFIPHFNRLSHVDTQNMFLLLDAASQLGIYIAWRDVVARASAVYRSLPPGQDPAMIPAPGFHHLRKIIREGNFGEQTTARKTDLETRVWKETAVKPLPTPSITEIYRVYKQARPAVTLAHPMLYNQTPADLRPYIREWQHEIGLIALECHYTNVFYPEWKALADELGLLVSAGSDRHAPYIPGDAKASVPVVQDDQADIPALLDILRAAGS